MAKNKKNESTLYFFYSIGCAFCKKMEPNIDEINKRGDYEILKLDLAEPDNKGFKDELAEKYKLKCGTPLLINSETGQNICGYREKEAIEKWVKGEEVPPPPQPKGPPPKPPLMDCPKKEEKKWIDDYKKWLEENNHLPQEMLSSPETILSRPRPKTEPPTMPQITSVSDEELEIWGNKYSKWRSENEHLPNLQPTEVILENMKKRRESMANAQQVSSQSPIDVEQIRREHGLQLANYERRVKKIESKLDTLLKHLGVKSD